MTLLGSIIRYINVGRLLHLIALIDFTICGIAIFFMSSIDATNHPGALTQLSIVVLLFGGMSVYAEMDEDLSVLVEEQTNKNQTTKHILTLTTAEGGLSAITISLNTSLACV